MFFDKFLKIDTTDRKEIKLGLINDSEITESFQSEKQSENLLVYLDQFLKKNNSSLSELNSILVNVGPGSYTGTRIGVTVANTLGWSLNIPVFGYNDDNFSSVLETAAKNAKTSADFQQIVLPYYMN